MNPQLLHSVVMDAPWDEESRSAVMRAVDRVDAPARSNAADLARMATQNHAVLRLNGERAGTLVYEVLDGELFVTALVATRRGVDLLAVFERAICDHARSLGCDSVRFGTSRPGMVEKTKALGYRVAGVVMRKSL